MKSVAIIGKFDTVDGVSDGQAVKTNILAQEIERVFGKENVLRINTYGWKKHPAILFGRCVAAVRKCDNVIFMTDEGGIKVFPWLLRCANVAGRCKLHYVVVGGWLVHVLEKHKFLTACLKHFDGIYVETNAMKSGLERKSFDNIYLMPNFKALQTLAEDELIFCTDEPYKFCTFSRVMKEKGIEDAVEAVKAVNQSSGRIVCTLDIYGQVDSGQTEWFENLSATFPAEIRYCGVIPYDKSVDVIKAYHVLLFPTKFYTEGIPGTIIDAYAAGVPVVASEWENFGDIIDQGRTGIGYPFSNRGCLKEILKDLVESPDRVFQMKKHCLVKAEGFLPNNVINILLKALS